jgi:hypothetical protein
MPVKSAAGQGNRPRRGAAGQAVGLSRTNREPLELGPSSGGGNVLEVEVHLTAPLGCREVVAGSTGQPLVRDVSLAGWSR